MNSHEPREAMSSVDKAWLRMDRPTNLMIINSVMLFDEVLDFAHFQAVCEHRLVEPYPRFRQRIVESPSGTGRLFWETDPYFDIRSHLRHIALPAPGDMATLQVLISKLMSGALDRSKPLWRFYLIENVGSGCAVFGRFHHCIADGIALIQVLLSMTDTDANAPWPEPLPRRRRKQAGLLTHVVKQVSKVQALTVDIAKTVLYESIQTIENPGHVLELAKASGMITAASSAILGKLLLLPADRGSVFKGELGTAKRVVWSDLLDLEQIKAIGRAHGATINDVLVTAVTGGLRQYLQARGDTLAGDLRAMVPVNLRPTTEEPQLGNRFSLVYLSMPISITDAGACLQTVKQRMNLLKNSPEPMVVYQVLSLLGMLPGDLADYAISLFASKATAVLTNVPGPRQTLYFAGKPLRRLLFWVPQSGKIGLGISIISYAGTVTVGLMTDEKLAPNPEAILPGFYATIAELATSIERKG